MKKWRNEGRGLERHHVKPKPQHYERSYSLGHRGSDASDEWGLPSPTSWVLPSALLSPFQPCGRCALCAAEPTHGHRVWPAALCCQKQRWQMSSAHLPACHQPVSYSLRPKGSELSLIFLSHCWAWENWSLCFGERTVHWNNSIVCKPALPKKQNLVMKQGQKHPSSSPSPITNILLIW